MPREKRDGKEKGSAGSRKGHAAAGEGKGGSRLMYYYAVLAVVVAAVIYAGIVVLHPWTTAQQPTASFETFKSNFLAAPRVGIVAGEYNSTGFSSTVGCATSVIIGITSSAQHHRDPGTIDFMVLNSTSCTLARGIGRASNSSYKTVPASACLNITASEPTIFINYSRTNATRISPNTLYTAGTQSFLLQCGIALQMG